MSEININTDNLDGQIKQLELLRQTFSSEQITLPEFSGEGSAARKVQEWGEGMTELISCMEILLTETADFFRNAGCSFSDTDTRIALQYSGQG